jgi:hypothetical protein
MSNKRSVIQRGCPEVSEVGTAQETIKPGYLVKGVSNIAKQTNSTTPVPKALALERDELGQGIDNSRQGSGTSTAFYASGDRVKVGVFDSGDEAIVFVASGQNIVEDDTLKSAGDGTFAEASTAGIVLARAMETLGAVTVETALRVQFL